MTRHRNNPVSRKKPFLMKGVSLLGNFALTAALVLGARDSRANVALPSVFGSHMVLQQEKPVRIWGTAQPGQAVTVTLGASRAVATPNAAGKWEVTFPPLKAGGAPLTLTATQGNTVTLNDILVGEVWVCSGQSNMEFCLGKAEHGREEATAANHPDLRLLMVPKGMAPTPQANFKGAWAACTPMSPGTVFAKPFDTPPPGSNGIGCGGFSAVAYFFGRELQKQLGVPVGLIEASWGGTRIEPWTPPSAPNSRTIFNSMIAPLQPLGIRGVIWYQGESNANDGMGYAGKMKTLIGGWRQGFKQGDFPFYYVQIAPFTFRLGHDTLPVFWEAQASVLSVTNTGMASTQDIGNLLDIHPTNKLDVGKRLALQALAKTYGRNVPCSGPTFRQLTPQGESLRVTFDNAGSGLVSRDGKPLSNFEVIDANGTGWKPAKAEISGTDSVVLSAAGVKHPVAMRFGWYSGAQPNLSNKEGLPAMTFRAGQPPSLPPPPNAKRS